MNILFSTTRQWNPGDEFILRGVINLLGGAGQKFNPIGWNRHPSIRPGNTLLDNSFDTIRHSLDAVDYVIFAGSPEWRGRRVSPLFRAIRDHGLRCSFIGIGSHGRPQPLSPDEKAVFLDHTDVVVCRDRPTYEALSEEVPDGRVHLLPCPAIFHARTIRPRQGLKRVGIVYQSMYTEHQSVTEQMRDGLVALARYLSDHIDVTIICNYIDEWAEASQLFGSRRVRYSYDSAAYEEFFDEVDCVVGTRVHGCLGALAVGTPAILLGSESDPRRAGTAEQIPELMQGSIHNIADLARSVLSIDAKNQSSRILTWRKVQMARYAPVISSISFKAGDEADNVPTDSQVSSVLRSNRDRMNRASNATLDAAGSDVGSWRNVIGFFPKKLRNLINSP